MMILIDRLIDVLWQITCLMASFGLCFVVGLLVVCIVQAVWCGITKG